MFGCCVGPRADGSPQPPLESAASAFAADATRGSGDRSGDRSGKSGVGGVGRGPVLPSNGSSSSWLLTKPGTPTPKSAGSGAASPKASKQRRRCCGCSSLGAFASAAVVVAVVAAAVVAIRPYDVVVDPQAVAATSLAILSVVACLLSCCGGDGEEAQADESQIAAEARRLRDTAWRSLGLSSEEVAKVREFVSILQSGGSCRGAPHAKGVRDRLADVDFCTAWRYLKAREWDMAQAEEALSSAVDRHEGLADLSQANTHCESLVRHWRGQLEFAGSDFQGDPVLWERPDLVDWQGFSTVGEELVVCCEVLCMKNLCRALDRLTIQERRPLCRMGVVVDLEGLPMSFARPQNLKALRHIIRLNSELHPEILKWVLLVRPPKKFEAIWKVIETYFDPGTRQKIRVVPPEDTAAELQRVVPAECIPRWLGGASRYPRPELSAGRIPRRLLREVAQASANGVCKPPAIMKCDLGDAAERAPFAGSGRSGMPLMRLREQLRRRTDFAAKERSFPRSEWSGPGGALPPRHSWGSLSDVSALPAFARLNGNGGASAPSGRKPMLELLDVDVFRSSEEDPIFQAYEHPSLAPQHFRGRGDNRFFLVVNWIIGQHQQVVLAALNPPPEGAGPKESAEWQMWNRFLAQPPTARWRRLRVSAACFEGPYIVNELLRPLKPTHIGRYLPSCSEGQGYLEVTINLTSSDMRRLRVVFQHSYHLIVNGLAYYLCGDAPGEPVERLMFAHYCSFLDVQRLRQV